MQNKRSHIVRVIAKKWLSENVFELRLQRPTIFSYLAGQKILCSNENYGREYSLVSCPEENELALCIKHVTDGAFSPYLAGLKRDDQLILSEPYGFFTHQGGPSVFVATGTGVAPFVSYIKSGVRNYTLLHGVRTPGELYYQKPLSAAGTYIPCLSGKGTTKEEGHYSGRVTGFLQKKLARGSYDFYLCGSGAMIRDVMHILDSKFADSRVFTETFFPIEE